MMLFYDFELATVEKTKLGAGNVSRKMLGVKFP